MGRQLPEISEMPASVRRLCVENYTAALAGERGRFAFTSYGHAYSVDAVPVRGQDGCIDAVMAVATPVHSYTAAVAAHLRTAEGLDRSAELAEERAERYRLAGRGDAELAERHAATTARRGRDSERERTRSACRHASLLSPGIPRRSRHGRPRCSAWPLTASRRLRSPSRSASAPPPSKRISRTSSAGSASATDVLRSPLRCVTDSSTSSRECRALEVRRVARV